MALSGVKPDFSMLPLMFPGRRAGTTYVTRARVS